MPNIPAPNTPLPVPAQQNVNPTDPSDNKRNNNNTKKRTHREATDGESNNIQPAAPQLPEVHYSHPMATYHNIDIDLIGSWENRPGEKLVVHPFGQEVRMPDLQPEVKRRVFAALVEITQSSNIGFYAPKPGTSPHNTPTVFLIYNLTETQSQILLNREVWSSKSITFRVTAMEPVRPNYLFSIRDFTTQSEDEVKHSVLRVWRSQESQDFLTSLHKTFPETLRHKAGIILQNFTDSLKVKRLDTKNPGNACAPTFNIYIQASLIPDDGLWCLLRDYYASQEYALRFQLDQPGSTSASFFHCSICHSIDHPRGLCKFPAIEGWKGPFWRIPGAKRDTSDRNKNKFTRQKRLGAGATPRQIYAHYT
ncbi:hypothetical protein F5888DRAFT_1655080 [Russula emetica]|nr:hypothetical protein F5888DRAFT_1655080 [Russula emetica]